LVDESTEVQKKKPREITVSYQPSSVGQFQAVLWITFSDKARAKDREFTVTRELRGRAILPHKVEDGEGTAGITVSHDYGLEFSVESPSSDGPFATQTKELIITKSSKTPSMSFITATVRPPGDSVTG
jgi:hypothetical protein